MQCAVWRQAVRGSSLIAIVAMGLCLSTSGRVAAQSVQGSQDYVAYRAESSTTLAQLDELLKRAVAAGLKPFKDTALEREGLWVFAIENAALAARNDDLFKGMERVPVNEFRGVLSVPAGNFYLRFAAGVSAATARKRVEAIGFKVLTPPTDTGTVLVVEGTGRAADRQSELNRLKKLDQVLYVAPNDIPLRIPARNQ